MRLGGEYFEERKVKSRAFTKPRMIFRTKILR